MIQLYILGLFTIFVIFTGCGGSGDSTETDIEAKINYSWVKQIGTNEYDYAGGITKDSNNFLYIVGATTGDFQQTNTNNSFELMISKYDENNSIKNTQIYLSDYQNSVEDITIDENNNLYITGKIGNSHGNRIYLMKLDSSLTNKWTKTLSVNSNDVGKKVIYSNNKVYVGGFSGGSSGYNAQIYKLDLNGTIEWQNSFGSIGTDAGHNMAIDTEGNLYITGGTTGTLDGETKSGSLDAFIIKVTNDGIKYWSEQFGAGSDSFTRANGITIDNLNNLYITGSTNGSLGDNEHYGNDDIFISKYDTSGNQLWVKQFGTTVSDKGLGIVHDSNGSIYVLNISAGDLDGTNSNLGGSDLIITKVESNGTLSWSKHIGTAGNEGEESDIYIDNTDTIYVTGTTSGSFKNTTNQGSSDVFFMKVK
jgi:hypothetical protein